MDHLAAFLLTVGAIVLVPGPSVLFIVSRGVALGRRAALATVVGNTAGLLVLLLLITVGLGPALAASERLATAVRFLGAGYLVVLGVRALRGHRGVDAPTPGGPGGVAAAVPLRVVVREGFVVGATNPKGLVILTAILPTFIHAGGPDHRLQPLSMGLLVAAFVLVCDSTWAMASGSARAWLGRSPRRVRGLDACGGAVMVALGFGLALEPARA